MYRNIIYNKKVTPTFKECVLCLVTQFCLTLCNLPGSSVHGDSSGKNTGVSCHDLLQGNLPNPEIEPGSPALQVDSLPTEQSGKHPIQSDREQILKIGMLGIQLQFE